MEEEFVRVRLPRGNQMLGVVETLLGASRFIISCKDGKTRGCRIPGRYRKRITIRVGDIVIVEPWDIEPETKGDIVWIYNRTQANWLRSNGHV